jgi:hypothetical protein
MSPSTDLRKDTDPLSEALVFSIIKTRDGQVQRLFESECYTSSSEICRICITKQFIQNDFTTLRRFERVYVSEVDTVPSL